MVGDVPRPDPCSPDDLLADLTAAQRAAVTSTAAPLCVVAAAGAGKTRVVTRRIAHRVVTGSADEQHVLALTFTRKAAGELRERLRALGLGAAVTAGTFHSVASAQLRQWWLDRHVAPPALLTSKARLVAQLAAERKTLQGVPIADLAACIEWAKARLVAPGEAEAALSRRPLPASAAEIAGLFQRYQHELRRRRVMDFDDLLGRCVEAMETDTRFAAAQRWRWRHLFVDEYQDLNPLQFRLLRAWLGDRADLCVVGDPHQAIYGWNGADPSLLAGFNRHWPEGEVVRLDDNHRCSPQVVAAGAAVLGGSGMGLASTRDDGPPPTVSAFRSDAAEAQAVARQLDAAHNRGVAWAEMAVLVRTNAQIPAIRSALGNAGVPCRVAGAQPLLERPAVQGALDDLRRRSRMPFAFLAGDLAASARAEDAGGAGPADGHAGDVALLATLAAEYCSLDARPTAEGFLAWLPAATGDDAAPARAVTLATFHRAKGLEWRAVWLCGLEQGLVPLGKDGRTDEEEERRLLYVAVTRASHELHCSWAETRSFGGRGVTRRPSPWLPLLAPATTSGRPPDEGGPDGWRRRLAEQRRALGGGGREAPTGSGRPGPLAGERRAGGGGAPASRAGVGPGGAGADPALVARLQAWRAQRARATGVPAYVVLHDHTLEALAVRCPADEEQLLAVPGLGPVKAARFGPQLLEVLGAHRATA
jgi:DNA helicase-2/ATP-dependent DNA helicase PcrA